MRKKQLMKACRLMSHDSDVSVAIALRRTVHKRLLQHRKLVRYLAILLLCQETVYLLPYREGLLCLRRLGRVEVDYLKVKDVIGLGNKLLGGGEVPGLVLVVAKAIVALFLMVTVLLLAANLETSGA
jgi:hypothetical protein